MPTSTALSRVKSDFFEILIPGFFVLVIILSVGLAFTQTKPGVSFTEITTPIIDLLKDNWVLSLITFIMVYLIGNLIRSIRVSVADRINKKIYYKITKNPIDKLVYESSFPYPLYLEHLKKQLMESELISDFPLPKKENLYPAYNFWKMAICSESPDAFNYIQEFESRVRLFSGMFWAGVFGIVGSTALFILCLLNKAAWPVWGMYTLILFIVSVLSVIAFGRNIQRVRSQEVYSVFMEFHFLLKKKEEEKRKSKEDKTSNTADKHNIWGPIMNLFRNKEKE